MRTRASHETNPAGVAAAAAGEPRIVAWRVQYPNEPDGDESGTLRSWQRGAPEQADYDCYVTKHGGRIELAYAHPPSPLPAPEPTHGKELGESKKNQQNSGPEVGAPFYPLAQVLEVDGGRVGRMGTGIYVRAKRGGIWGSFDMADLTRPSLLAWLRSRGGENEWAEQVVCMLLNHATNNGNESVVGGAPPAPAGWRDIESAPRGERTVIIVGGSYGGAWHTEFSDSDDIRRWMTHWMPLPEPPA